MTKTAQHEHFATLYAKHHLDLLRFVLTLIPNRSHAEDVVQETATRLWQKFEHYDSAQPFLPWARKFAYYEVLKHRKKQATDCRAFSDELIEKLAEQRIDQEEILEARREALQLCLNKLGRDARRILVERYGNQIALNQLAGELGKTPNALSLSLHRLRQKLIECTHRHLSIEGWA